jgi:hypothetical protein
MKKLFLTILLLSITFYSYSQTYKFGAGSSNGINFKVVGNLVINDKQVLFETFEKDKKTLLEYDIIKKTNGMIYFTDGVMTHYFTFINENSTKKGFDYDTLVVFNFDKSQAISPVTYFCKLQE